MEKKALDQREVKSTMLDTVRILDRCYSTARVSQHEAGLEGSDRLRETLECLENDLRFIKDMVEELIEDQWDMGSKEIRDTIDRMVVSGESSWEIINSQGTKETGAIGIQ